jgi:O-acetyl-ADP-ribose deacetylase (regulator of RNase III)
MNRKPLCYNRIITKTGDIFLEEVEAIVNPVNCVGVMGKGLALQFKERFPENFNAYKEACKNTEVTIGKMHIYRYDHLAVNRYIVNFPTKRHWKDRSYINDIEEGLKDLQQVINRLNIKSIAIPALGCGLGGLPWKDVSRVINDGLTQNDAKIIVFAPGGLNG